MKKYTNIIILSILVLLLSACSEKVLDKMPLDQYSDAAVWTDIDLASAYLNSCYDGVGHGFLTKLMLSDVTDETFVGRGSSSTPYNLGAMSADNVTGDYSILSANLANSISGGPWYIYTSWAMFPNVQKINLFLDNIDKVSDSYKELQKAGIKAQTDVLKGEALFLRAWIYTNLCRTYGGVPILNKANKLRDDFSGITRGTFKETVDFIVKDCDDAAQLLKLKSQMEMGRATKEAALTLKSRMLLFAASDLTADGTAENQLVGYITPNRTSLWTTARDAAKAVIDLGTCQLADFGAPDQKSVAINYFEFFKAYDLSNIEVIWGKMFLKNLGSIHFINQMNGPNGLQCYGRNGPLQSMVNEYEMKDGSKFFDHFTINNNNEYINTSTKFHHENPYYDREARFYASVLYDSAVWEPRFADLAQRDPLGIYDRRTRVIMQGGVEISKTYGIDTRNGPVANWNGCYGGYLTKKFSDNTNKGNENNQNIWIYIRYAEIILNYAEACLELGDIPSATTYINMIRERAGLPDFTGDITRALRHERKVELYGEEHRWYDIRRWKILEESLSPPNYGIDILEINDGGKITTTWRQIEAQVANNPVKKMYWIPIETDELKKAPQLVQNPGY